MSEILVWNLSATKNEVSEIRHPNFFTCNVTMQCFSTLLNTFSNSYFQIKFWRITHILNSIRHLTDLQLRWPHHPVCFISLKYLSRLITKKTAHLPPKQACWGLTDVISTQVLLATCGQMYSVFMVQSLQKTKQYYKQTAHIRGMTVSIC